MAVKKNKRILILGNLGYVGAELTKHLRKSQPNSILIGYDIGYFSHCTTTQKISPECQLNLQYYGDVRKFDLTILNQVDHIIALAAISNDPIGNKFELPTLDINYKSVVNIAKKAKQKGVSSFVFASSCSVYGFAQNGAKNESSELNPLTPYAKSKVLCEKELAKLASSDFKVTSLRFATACGMSDRLRLDLVLNDFVASALLSNRIDILSDGTPWRPLINVKDMAIAIEWALFRKDKNDGLIVNTGADNWNFQVKDLAIAVKKHFPSIAIHINERAQPDKRSYRVDFNLFKKLAPNHQPKFTLDKTILELRKGLIENEFKNSNFRNSELIRLNVINRLIQKKKLNSQLELLA